MTCIKKNWYIILLLLFSSIITIALFSFVSSPVFGTHYMHDSSMFEVIGKAWGQGLLPYRDLWDSKGPYVFFINMIGYLMGGKLGLFLLEIINIWITKLWLYRTLRLSLSRWPSLILSALSVSLFVPLFWYYGNNQAEWCLPFLAASVYYIYYFSKSEKNDHNKIGGFVYGLTIGISIMSRMTNCVYVVLCVFAIFIWLLFKKSWKSLIQNILWGLLGILTSILPFIIYFAANNLLYDMLYASIFYNFNYIQITDDAKTILDFFARIAGYFPVMIISFYLLIKYILNKNYKPLFVWLLPISIAFVLIEYKTFAFMHYFLIFLPFAITLVTSLFDEKKNLIVKNSCLGYIVVFGIICSTAILLPSSWPDVMYISRQEVVTKLVAIVPKESTFLAINEPKQHTVYLKNDITPNNKYFYYQEVIANIDESIKDDIIEDFKNNMPEYVLFTDDLNISLMPKMPTIEESMYAPFFEKYYDIIATDTIADDIDVTHFYLFHLRSNAQ